LAENNTDFQMKSLPASTALGALSRPTNYSGIGSSVFDIKALNDPASTMSSFDEAVTVTVDYTDDEISGLDESSLWVHRHDGSEWNALTNCVVDTSANTVTCETSNFSVFGLFGQTASAQSSSGGGVFVPPSTPIVKSTPKVENNKVVFEIDNFKRIAISETEDFSQISWQDYEGEYINDTGKPMYIKFRSEEGGVSEIFVINSVNENICSVCNYEGKLIKYVNSPKVYKIENNQKRWITSEEAFNYFGYNWSDIILAGEEFLDGENITKPTAQTTDFVFERNLELGSSGEDVRQLQVYLNNNGFLVDITGVGSPGQESTYFGNLTKQALIKYQLSVGLPAYGYFGPMTRGLINK